MMSSVHHTAKKELILKALWLLAQVFSDKTCEKRLQHCCTDWKCATANGSSSRITTHEFTSHSPEQLAQLTRWTLISVDWLLTGRSLPRVMVSTGLCFAGKSRLHFVDEKAKVYADYGIPLHSPEVSPFNSMVLEFIQDWVHANCDDFIAQGSWTHQTAWPSYVGCHARSLPQTGKEAFNNRGTSTTL